MMSRCIHVYVIHVMIVMNSEAAACMMSQNTMCTNHHYCTNLLYPAHISVYHITCIHNLRSLIHYIYTQPSLVTILCGKYTHAMVHVTTYIQRDAIHPSMHTSSVCAFIHSFIHHSFMHSCTHAFMHSCIHQSSTEAADDSFFSVSSGNPTVRQPQ
jgi:hypothetical protein